MSKAEDEEVHLAEPHHHNRTKAQLGNKGHKRPPQKKNDLLSKGSTGTEPRLKADQYSDRD